MIILNARGNVMKIQEMRPGVLHLSKRLEFQKGEDFSDIWASEEAPNVSGERVAPLILSELDQPRWSVVSFDRKEAGGLTYRQASALIDDLEKRGVAGLCIVTDEAAERIKT